MNGSLSSISTRLVNGSTGDPSLLVDYPGRDDAILFDAGENCALDAKTLGDLRAVFLSHHHVDHFVGFDRIVRANLDRDKAVSVYGPRGTIRKVYARIKSYDYQFFPFQKVVIDVHEILPGKIRSAVLECSQRFPRPEISEAEWSDQVIHTSDDWCVEAVHVDHTTPCLSFALVHKSPEIRIVYVTDTAWSEKVRPRLLRLAKGAARLYCDSFYAHEQLASAAQHRHMTAIQAAEFAREAKVRQLVLIHFASRYRGRYQSLIDQARTIFPAASAEIPLEPAKNPRSQAKNS